MNSVRLITLVLLQFYFFNLFAQKDDIQDNVFTVVVDAGHGGKDPGNTGNGYIEKDIALKISLMLGRELEKNGVNVNFVNWNYD